MNLFFATDAEARILRKQVQGTFLRILKEQPEPYIWDLNAEGWTYQELPLRYPSGIYAVKETWDIFALPNEIPSIVYKAGSTAIPIVADWGIKYQRKDNSHNWRSPITMPAEAIRWHIEVETVVKRVQELILVEKYNYLNKIKVGEEISKTIDVDKLFKENWNARFAKPVRKGDGYTCYPYDDNNIKDVFKNKPYLKKIGNINTKEFYSESEGFTWKGKSLTIYPDPYLATMKWKKT